MINITSTALDMLCFTDESKYIFNMGYLIAAISGQKDAICIFDVNNDCFVENGIGNIGFTKNGSEKFLWQRLGRELQEKYFVELSISKKNEMAKEPKDSLSIIKSAIALCGYIHTLSANPFLDSGFIIINDQDVIYNTIRKSQYFYNLEAIEATGLAKLSLFALRANDDITHGGFSFIEIILAWQIFHNKKIMAIPCLYGKERGLGKTTLLSIGDMLYLDSTVEVINSADTQLLKWGDIRDGKRIVIYDDVPNHKATVSMLSKQIKSDATQFSSKTVNIKGGGIKQTNALNQGITTNYIGSIPLDFEDDRRIYPIEITKDCYTDEELLILARDVPPISKDNQGNRFFQNVLNHCLFLYESTKDDAQLHSFLNKRVPLSSFKREVIRRKSPKNTYFISILENANSFEQMLEDLEKYIVQDNDSNCLQFLMNEEIVNISLTSH